MSDTLVAEAFTDQQIRVHYQPIVTAGGRVAKVEALLRWVTPEGRVRPASEWIDHALAAGLPVTEYLCEEILAEMADWAASWPLAGVRIAVNVERDDLRRGRIRPLLRLADRLPVEVELSEREAVDCSIRHALAALKARGCTVALDDVGAGATSLRSLEALPIDGIKLDRYWVHRAPRSARAAALARVWIDSANALGLDVTAEGIETNAQAAWASAVGCKYAQGFYFGAARPLAEWSALIARMAMVRKEGGRE